MATAFFVLGLFVAFRAALSTPMDVELIRQPRTSLADVMVTMGSTDETQMWNTGNEESYKPNLGLEDLPDINDATWPLMIGPFFRYIPLQIGEYCQCRGYGDCGCCVGFYEKPFGIRNNVCGNLTVGPDALTHSRYGLHAKLIYDKTQLLDIFTSELELPSACVSLIPFNELQGCAKVNDVYYDANESKTCGCVVLELRWSTRHHPIISLPRQCICIGKPVAQSRKRGLLGMPPMLDMIQTVKNVVG